MEKQSQAISFANSYFSLVDGLAQGLEDHLANNVVLDWFGRTIRGRANVTAFMKTHKVTSRHVFNSITPVNDINYGKAQVTKKQWQTKRDNSKTTEALNRGLNFEKLSIIGEALDPENNNNNMIYKNANVEERLLDSEGNLQLDEVSMTYELDENDLASLFALEITPTQVDEIQANINQIKSVELLQTSSGRIADFGCEFSQGDGSNVGESYSSVKYVEAIGHIEFSKRTTKRGTEFQKWRRQTQLQVAYSVQSRDEFVRQNDEVSILARGGEDEPSTGPKQRLPSLEEITALSNNLVPNTNNFGGYLPTGLEFTEERNNFLENFNAEFVKSSMRTPQYIQNRLVFGDANEARKKVDKHDGNGFVFNYLIHLIIYQGTSRCRRNLSQEFGPIAFKNTASVLSGSE